ncbi:MAG: hypothetical protein PHU85_14290 [Phycisphaerae bacterium]|nr:hypothetical protein [Phycisphaerae bacterium]
MTEPNSSIPRGVEVLVKKAAVDAQFRATLLARRAAAAAEIGLLLTPSEKAMLNAVPVAQIEAIVGQTQVDPAIRPALLGKVAAAMLLALGVISLPISETDAMLIGILPGRDGASAATQPAASPAADTPRLVLGIQPMGPVQPPQPEGIRPDRPPTSQADLTQRIDKLVSQLDVKDFHARTSTAAEQELRSLDMNAVIARLKELLETKTLSANATEQVKAILATPAKIDLLVRKLEFEVVSRRGATVSHDTTPDEAERLLLEIGPWSLPAVKAALASGKMSADATARAKRIIAKLETAATSRPGEPLSRGVRPDRPPQTQPAALNLNPQNTYAGRVVIISGVLVQAGEQADLPPPVAGIAPTLPRPTTPPTSQPTTQPVSLAPGEFDRLVAQLDDPKFPVREAAEQRLAQAGKAILPQLQKAKENKDLPPEAAWRIKRILDKLNPQPAQPPPDRPMVRFGAAIDRREVIDGLRADPPSGD